jgi:hypothetical protein
VFGIRSRLAIANVVDTLRDEPETFVAIVGIALLAVVLDAVWKRSATARAVKTRARTT